MICFIILKQERSNDFLFNLLTLNNKSLINSSVNLFILKQRLIEILFFLLLSFLLSVAVTTSVYCFLIGFFYGFISVFLFFQLSFNGMFYSFFYVLPVLFLYVLCIALFNYWVKDHKSNTNNSYYKNVKYKIYTKMVFLIVFLIISVLFELKFEKNFLKIFTNILY